MKTLYSRRLFFRNWAQSKRLIFRDYSALQTEVLQHLKSLGIAPNAQNIAVFQEDLAIHKAIVPPHYTGWVDCKRCGIRPAEAYKHGSLVDKCQWCIHMHDGEPPETNEWIRCMTDVEAVGLVNRTDYFAEEAQKRINSRGENDLTDYGF